ncbi:MAG: PrgI family protein [Micropruina sp.]|uniref:SCO6880 family protein n=1 Tax=Micropruina sp. TaxID=2737536 RepID=UPI0039E61470
MDVSVYSEYGKDRQGFFFGLSGPRLILLVAAGVPAVWALGRQQWLLLAGCAAGWLLLMLLVAVPIAGRPAVGWLAAIIRFGIGSAAGWTVFRARAAQGIAEDLDQVDLPGVLDAVTVHDGPPQGPDLRRVAIIQHHASRCWAVTAAVTHPGLALVDAADRDSQGAGLTALLDACLRTELVDEVQFVIRSVPDDGAEREQWLARHQPEGAPVLARQVNDGLASMLAAAGVRTEAFVTVIVPERRLARVAKENGRGIEGRGRALGLVMAEVEGHLRTGLRMRQVSWLTSPELAVAVRTGFAPGDRASIVAAVTANEHGSAVNAGVPWAMAGPSGADLAMRHYSHDAWNSISATIKLPARGAVIGALAPVLAPTEPGERRSLLVAFPILPQTIADRETASAEWAADMGEELRQRAGIRTRAKERIALNRTRQLDTRLATGHALTRPYAVATVTVAKMVRVAESGRRLDAAIRRAGFAPLRLDLAQDAGFAASTIPLGTSLLPGRQA